VIARRQIENLDWAHYEIFISPLFLPDARVLGLMKASRNGGLLVRIIAYLVPALVACGFFLYVLIQFRRDESSPRRLDTPEQTGQSANPSKRVVNFPKVESTGGMHHPRAVTSEQACSDARISYVETTLPAALVVAPFTARPQGKRKHIPPRRIA
jgi:hypothetical protein